MVGSGRFGRVVCDYGTMLRWWWWCAFGAFYAFFFCFFFAIWFSFLFCLWRLDGVWL